MLGGLLVSVVFFFKQKTAYEMRISDWSSDVCSSDLLVGRRLHDDDRPHVGPQAERCRCAEGLPEVLAGQAAAREEHEQRAVGHAGDGDARGVAVGVDAAEVVDLVRRALATRQRHARRSEEPTSELQSLMRTSDAR